MDYPTEGGSYTRNPKTGRLTLVHRTESDAVTTKPTAEAAGDLPAAETPTATKSEKA
jgi:hypothetical protein